MSIGNIISQMESLAAHCENIIGEGDPDSIWKADVAALNKAIERLNGEFSGANAAEVIQKIMEKEIRNYLEMLSKELPKHKYRTESLRLRHKLRKSAGLRSQEYRQRECSSSD